MLRVSTDEILRTIGKWDDTSAMMAAGKIAVRKIAQYINDGISFNKETTLCIAIFGQGKIISLSHNVPSWYQKRFQDK